MAPDVGVLRRHRGAAPPRLSRRPGRLSRPRWAIVAPSPPSSGGAGSARVHQRVARQLLAHGRRAARRCRGRGSPAPAAGRPWPPRRCARAPCATASAARRPRTSTSSVAGGPERRRGADRGRLGLRLRRPRERRAVADQPPERQAHAGRRPPHLGAPAVDRHHPPAEAHLGVDDGVAHRHRPPASGGGAAAAAAAPPRARAAARDAASRRRSRARSPPGAASAGAARRAASSRRAAAISARRSASSRATRRPARPGPAPRARPARPRRPRASGRGAARARPRASRPRAAPPRPRPARRRRGVALLVGRRPGGAGLAAAAPPGPAAPAGRPRGRPRRPPGRGRGPPRSRARARRPARRASARRGGAACARRGRRRRWRRASAALAHAFTSGWCVVARTSAPCSTRRSMTAWARRGALVRIGAGGRLVEEHERARAGGREDRDQAPDVGGEGEQALGDRLVVADVGEHPVEHRQPGPRGRHAQRRTGGASRAGRAS